MTRMSEAEDFLEPVDPGRAADHPASRAHRAFGVDAAARCSVHEFQALAGAREDYMVVADRIAAAQCREADIAGAAGAGYTVPRALFHRFERHLATRRRGPPEGERRARRRVDLAAMVHFHDLDIPIGAEPARNLLDEPQQ